MKVIPELFIVTDHKTDTFCMFEKGKFNNTQEFINESKKYNAQELAAICREMGDWLRIHHYDKLF